MRRGWVWLAAVCLLLGGCTGKSGQRAEEAPAAPEGLTMELEHGVYDPSLTTYTYMIRNDTDETVEFGEPYSIQRKDGEGWTDLTMKDNAGWTAIGYALAPGQAMALSCGFANYEETPRVGEYRLVKTVGGVQLTAEFSLGESPYTARTPYGFVPLEELPEDYSAAGAAAEDVVFSGAGARNLDAVEAFLEKVSLGAPCQLRTVQDYGQSAVMVIDVIFEGGPFLWRMRSNGAVAEQRLAFLVTDGENLYLSSCADWETGEQYGDKRVFLVPENTALSDRALSLVSEMMHRQLESGTVRLQVWSPDGVWSAGVTAQPGELALSYQGASGSAGCIWDISELDSRAAQVQGLSWQADNVLRLDCRTETGNTFRMTLDTGTLAGLLDVPTA